MYFYTVLLAVMLSNCNLSLDQDASFNSPEQLETVKQTNDRIPVWSQQLAEMKSYLKEHSDLNQDLAMFIDFKTPSQRCRFYVVNMNTQRAIDSGLVAHGSGSQFSPDSLVFSNVPESYKSSLGYYKTGAKYKGNFGWSYKLHGLSTTNSNAYKRLIVLHPYGCVPNEEQQEPICFSLGCPMVSYSYMDRLYSYIDGSKKPLLLKMFY